MGLLDLKNVLWGLAPLPHCRLKAEAAFKPGSSSTLCLSAINANQIFLETLERWGNFFGIPKELFSVNI